jgi:hypothetical protein
MEVITMKFPDQLLAAGPAAHPLVCFTRAELRALLVRGNGTG